MRIRKHLTLVGAGLVAAIGGACGTSAPAGDAESPPGVAAQALAAPPPQVVAVTMPVTCGGPYTVTNPTISDTPRDDSNMRDCLFSYKCIPSALIPPGADAACAAHLQALCPTRGFPGSTRITTNGEPCVEMPPSQVEMEDTCQTLSEIGPALGGIAPDGPSPPPFSCNIALLQNVPGLCANGTTSLQQSPGCTLTGTPAGGHTFLAEFGALDGKSADFQCQWVESCTVTASDRSLTVTDSTVTTCKPVDSGLPELCSDADRAAAQAVNQARTILQTYHWYQGLCEAIDPGGLLCHTVTRDEFRTKAQADCNAKSVGAVQSSDLCQNAANAASASLSTRVFYCCTSPVNPVPPDPASSGGAGGSGSGSGAGGAAGGSGSGGAAGSGNGGATGGSPGPTGGMPGATGSNNTGGVQGT